MTKKTYNLNIEIDAKTSLQEAIKEVERLIELRAQLNGKVDVFSDSDIKGLVNLNQEIDQTNALLKKAEAQRIALLKVHQQEEKLKQQKLRTMSIETREQERLTREAAKAAKEHEKQIKAVADAESAYKKLSKELEVNRQRAKDLLAENRKLTQSEEDFIKKTQELDLRLKQVDKTMGQSQRFVGEYERGYSGLRNSVNQITRELPAFTLSMNTGFLAISNNLPILVDEITKLRVENAELIKQGKPAESVFKKLSSAIFSWGTALSVGVTLLTLFGGKILTFFSDLIKGTDEAAEAQAKLEERINLANEKLEKQIELNKTLNRSFLETEEVLGVFLSGADKSRISTAELTAAISDLQDQLNKITPDKVTILQNEIDAAKTTAGEFAELQRKQAEKQRVDVLANIALLQKELETRKKRNDQTKIEKDEAHDLSREIRKIKIEQIESEFKRNEALLYENTKNRIEDVNKTKASAEQKKELITEIEKKLQADLLALRIKGLDDLVEIFNKETEAAEKRSRDNINLTLDNKALEASLTESKIDDEKARFQREIENFKVQFDEKGNVTKESFDHIELLKKVHEKNLSGIEKEEEEKRSEERKKKTREQIETADKTFSQILAIQTKKGEENIKQIDKEIAAQEKSLQAQQSRAERGLSNTLELEQEKAAQLELERQKEQKKQERRLKIQTYYNLLAGYAKTDPNTATTKAARDIAISEGITAAFAMEGGIVGDVRDTTKIFGDSMSKSHGGGNDRLVVADKREGILTVNEMNTLGRDGFYNLKAMLNNPLNDDIMFPKVPVFAPVPVANSNKELVKEIRDLKGIMKNKPVSKSYLDNVGNVITETVEGAVKHKMKIISQKPKFRR